MREGSSRRRVGQVVGRHVDGLHRGDGTLLGGSDAFLQGAHFGGQGRLVTDGRRHTAQKGGNFRTRLGETEDIVDEEENVLVFLVAEIFGDGQSGQSHPGAGAGRLVHLSVNQGGFFQNLGFLHFQEQVVPFTGSLADSGENRVAAMLGGDVADQFHDDDGLADAGTAEEADLPAFLIGRQQVDDLDAGFQDLFFRGLFDQGRRRAVDGIAFLVLNRAHFIDRFA